MSHDASSGEICSRLARAATFLNLSSFIQKVFHTVNPGAKYLHNWHIDLIADYLLACERGDTKRLIINMPPRYMKSLCVSVAWPAWLLGHDPSRRIIVASYAERLALKHSLDSRLVMQAEWYHDLFPETQLVEGQNEKHKFVTTQRGFRLATSVGGTVTGEGGNFLIIDDPHNPSEINSPVKRQFALDWFDQTFSSRLDDKKKGVFALVMQRLHSEDLTGHLTEREGHGWEVLKIPVWAERTLHYQVTGYGLQVSARPHPNPLPEGEGISGKAQRSSHNEKNKKDATPSLLPTGEGQDEGVLFKSKKRETYLFLKHTCLHPEREGEKEIAQLKRDLGGSHFAAQYMQEPVPGDGELVSLSWFGRFQGSGFGIQGSGKGVGERSAVSKPREPSAREAARHGEDSSPSRAQKNISHSWDTAIKGEAGNDYSVCTVWREAGGRHYLLYVLREQIGYPAQKRKVLELAERFPPDAVLIEDKASGQMLLQELRLETALPLIAIRPTQDKLTRFLACTPLMEAGQVWLPDSAPWLVEFERELLCFPKSKHDDQVDATSQYLNWWKGRNRGRLGVRGV